MAKVTKWMLLEILTRNKNKICGRRKKATIFILVVHVQEWQIEMGLPELVD